MKKFFALLLALLLLALPLVACSKDGEEDGNKEIDLAVTGNDLLYTPEGTTDVYHYVYHSGDEVAIVGYEGAHTAHTISVPEKIDDRPVTLISTDAFKSVTSITAVTLPNTIVEIEAFAFYGCSAMTTINMPTALKAIGEGAFANCTALYKEATLVIPDTVTEIGMIAFYGCESMQGVQLPVSFKNLPDQLFMGCKALTTVAWSAEGEEIGSCAFMGCESLTTINVPGTLKTVGDYAFADCKVLPALSLPAETVCGNNVFYVSAAQ